MAHRRSPASRDRREVLTTRVHRADERRHDLTTDSQAREQVGGIPPRESYESTGHYHWRMRHKNLARPRLKTGRVHEIR